MLFGGYGQSIRYGGQYQVLVYEHRAVPKMSLRLRKSNQNGATRSNSIDNTTLMYQSHQVVIPNLTNVIIYLRRTANYTNHTLGS